jgi:hypothetical protein
MWCMFCKSLFGLKRHQIDAFGGVFRCFLYKDMHFEKQFHTQPKHTEKQFHTQPKHTTGKQNQVISFLLVNLITFYRLIYGIFRSNDCGYMSHYNAHITTLYGYQCSWKQAFLAFMLKACSHPSIIRHERQQKANHSYIRISSTSLLYCLPCYCISLQSPS